MQKALLLILIAGLCSTVGNIFLKISRKNLDPSLSFVGQYLSPFFILASLFFLINLIIFAKALDDIPINIGYPILASFGFISLVISSWFILSEKMSFPQILGLISILIGIFLISYYQK